MNKLNNTGVVDLNLFMKHASPNHLQSLYMYGGSHMLIDSFKEGLEVLLKVVENQVYLFHFTIREAGLKAILENTTSSEELVLRGCQFGEVKKGFSLNPLQKYKLKKLDLYWTCRK